MKVEILGEKMTFSLFKISVNFDEKYLYAYLSVLLSFLYLLEYWSR